MNSISKSRALGNGNMLGDEFLIEILKQLPVKTLYQCISVCKSWQTLITSSYFISTPLNYQKAISNGKIVPQTYYSSYYGWQDSLGRDFLKLRLYVYCDDGFTFRRLRWIDCPAEFDCTGRVVGCCDGMVCLYSFHYSRRGFILWSPSQNKYIELNFPVDDPEGEDEPCFCGFGVDAYSNDYKVVFAVKPSSSVLREGTEGASYVSYVYSLRMGSSKAKAIPHLLPDRATMSPRGAHLEGVIHWAVARIGTTRNDVMPSFSILTFNLADETFGRITLPEEIISGDRNGRPQWYPMHAYGPMIIKVHGKECLCVYHIDATHSWLYIWVMDKHGVVESWRQVLKISKSGIVTLYDVRMNGEIMVKTRQHWLASVDPTKSEKCELISTQHQSYLGTYFESLVSLGPFCNLDLEETEGLRGD